MSRSSFFLSSAGALIFVALAGAGLANASQAPRRPVRRLATTRKRVASAPRLDPKRVNDHNLMEPVGPSSRGDAVIRAAIMLDRLKFSPGQIEYSYSDNMKRAVTAFQKEHGLEATGTVDAKTWMALNGGPSKDVAPPSAGQSTLDNPNAAPRNAGPPIYQNNQPKAQGSADTRNTPVDDASNGRSGTEPNNPPPALVPYTVSADDVAGPFTTLPRARTGEQLMLEEAKLPQLNYGSAREEIASKFHVNPKLLAQLNPGRNFDKPGEEILAPNVLTPAPAKAASVVVDGSEQSVRALDSQGKVLAFYPATVGSAHDPLPTGKWKILGKRFHPEFHYNPNLFWDSENKNVKATLPPGPKSPVGVVWISLSKAHYGIHGTPEPSTIGRTQSHGCIRLTNWDAEELANMVGPGTPAILQQ